VPPGGDLGMQVGDAVDDRHEALLEGPIVATAPAQREFKPGAFSAY
jgi:hypothetical protein